MNYNSTVSHKAVMPELRMNISPSNHTLVNPINSPVQRVTPLEKAPVSKVQPLKKPVNPVPHLNLAHTKDKVKSNEIPMSDK